MLRQMIKPYSLLFYLLAIIVSFFIGIIYAYLIEAGRNQMLAGGAIVLFNGVIGSFIGFVLSLFIAYKASRKIIIRLNIIIAIAIVAFWTFFAIKYQNRQNDKQQDTQPEKRTPTAPAPDAIKFEMSYIGNVTSFEKVLTTNLYQGDQVVQTMGLGMFAPNFYEYNVLYFYGKINHQKALNEHLPYDSITFKRDKYNNLVIATAPPWLYPQQLKLDYGFMYFKIRTIYRDFIEVEVNSKTGQSSFVSLYAGEILYWPEFLRKAHSIEFINPGLQEVKVKPLDHADEVSIQFSLMQPIAIQQDWLIVELRDNNYKKVGEDWVKWRDNGELLISYSLLS